MLHYITLNLVLAHKCRAWSNHSVWVSSGTVFVCPPGTTITV